MFCKSFIYNAVISALLVGLLAFHKDHRRHVTSAISFFGGHCTSTRFPEENLELLKSSCAHTFLS